MACLRDLPAVDFLAQAFVDQHVGVHRHADGQHHAGDAGQGEGEAEHGHHAEEDDRVDDQADDGNEAGHAVVNQHEEEGHARASSARRRGLV